MAPSLLRAIKRRPRLIVAIGVALIALITLICWAWTPLDLSGCGAEVHATHAAWISVDWTSQPVDTLAVTGLAEHTAAHRLHYLLPFTTYLRADGSFSPSYQHASSFVSEFRKHAPDIQLLAWIGLPLKNEDGLGVPGYIDLADTQTRANIARFSAQLLAEADFDGVHLDAETVRNDDADFLRLLDEVRAAIGSQRLLSVAGNDWRPDWVNRLPILGRYKWSSRYVRQVAGRVDQLAAMTYDSLMPHPALYRLWMREQVKGLSRSVNGTHSELLIGVSVSREKTATHHPDAESLPQGLAGICAGVKQTPGRSIQGIAIYASWEATPADWQLWQDWSAP